MVFEICKDIFSGNVDNLTEFAADCPFATAFGGGVMGSLAVMGIMLGFLMFVAFWVYTSMAWVTIAKRLKHKNSWLAWIPVARWAMILELGRFHWAWIFLILIPIAGWLALFVLLIISRWRLYDKLKYPGWFSLVFILGQLGHLLDLIIIGFVAWKSRKKMLFS